MQLKSNRDVIAGGVVYHPADGVVEIPDHVAKAEGYWVEDAAPERPHTSKAKAKTTSDTKA